jgi:hypothetical protein
MKDDTVRRLEALVLAMDEAEPQPVPAEATREEPTEGRNAA